MLRAQAVKKADGLVTMSKRRLISCLILVVLQGVCSNAETVEPEKVLRISCIGSPSHPEFQRLETIWRQALARQGMEVEFTPINASESLRRMQSGEFDGDCAHAELALSKPEFKHYRRVAVSLAALTQSIWHNDQQLEKTAISPKQLAASRFGYTQGELSARNLITLRGGQQFRGYASASQGLDALARGEIDYWVGPRYALQGIPQALWPRFNQPLISIPLFPYLHERHEKLIPELGKAMGEILERVPYHASHRAIANKAVKNPDVKRIVFVCALPENSKGYKATKNLYSIAFGRLGYQFDMRYAPPARGLADLLNGLADGSCGRTPSIESEIASARLIRIDIDVANIQFVAWSHRSDLRVNSIEDIIRGGYKVAYTRGNMVVDTKLEAYSGASTVTQATHGLRMLASRRLDLFISSKSMIELELSGSGVHVPLYQAGVVLLSTHYPYVSSRHSQLANRLTQVLRELIEKEEHLDPYR